MGTGKPQIKETSCKFEEELKNIIVSKNNVLGQSSKELFQLDIETGTKTNVWNFENGIDFSAVDIIHENLILCASNYLKQLQVIDQQSKSSKYII